MASEKLKISLDYTKLLLLRVKIYNYLFWVWSGLSVTLGFYGFRIWYISLANRRIF